MAEASSGREKTPPAKRRRVLQRDGFECTDCGAKGPQKGGIAILHVHHKCPDPDDRDRHAMSNLTTLCRHCHWWVHQRPTRESIPFEVTPADHRVLLPHDYLIMRLLHEYGPLSTSGVQERIGLDLAEATVRERLWILAGLDYEVASRTNPFVAQDAVSGDWGLRSQVAVSERGRVPDDMRTFLQRLEDEFVRRAVARGCDRETIAEVFDVVTRTVWYKQHRAQAYALPLEALKSGETPPPSGDVVSDRETEKQEMAAVEDQSQTAATGGETQSAEQSPDLGEPDEVWGTPEGTSVGAASSTGDQQVLEDASVQAALEDTIAALDDSADDDGKRG